MDTAGLAISGVLAVLAVIVAFDTTHVTRTSVYGVGPKAMTFVVAGILGILAIGNLINAIRGQFPPREEMDIQPVVRILGGMAALIAVIGYGGGFIIATALLFAMTASAFGRKAFHIDLVIGLGIATTVYLAFSKLLALSLPAGPLENLF